MFAWLLFGFLAVWTSNLAAQTYPSKPITLVVPYAPAGGTDVIARVVAEKLSANWGQPVIVENRPGANGTIGTANVARADPDGYTLVFVVSTHAINPSLYKKVPYDTVKAFAPISLVASSPFVLVVSPSLPAKTPEELVTLAKSKPGELSWGSSEGSTRVAGELFAAVAGVKMLNVPYKGGAPLMTDLLGGHVDIGVTSAVTALPHVSTGKLRALVVGSEKRSTALPDVSTGAEAGLPGFVANAWYGILAPAGTPADRVTKIQQEIARILETSEVKERLAQQGAEPIGSTPDEFDAFIKSEVAKWAKVVQDAGIRPE